MHSSSSSGDERDEIVRLWAASEHSGQCVVCHDSGRIRHCCNQHICNKCYYGTTDCPNCKKTHKRPTAGTGLVQWPVRREAVLSAFCVPLVLIGSMLLYINMIIINELEIDTLIERRGCAAGRGRWLACVASSSLQGQARSPSRRDWHRCDEAFAQEDHLVNIQSVNSTFISQRSQNAPFQHAGWGAVAGFPATQSGAGSARADQVPPSIHSNHAAVLGGVQGCVCAPACVVDECAFRESGGREGWDFEAASFQPLVTLGREDFLRGPSPMLWDRISLGRASGDCGTAVGGHAMVFGGVRSQAGQFKSERSLQGQAPAPRELRTLPVDVSGGGAWVFWLRYGTGRGPDAGGRCPLMSRAPVSLEASTDGGRAWAELKRFAVDKYRSMEFKKVVVEISGRIGDLASSGAGGSSNTTVFRWIQRDYYQTGDAWAIDGIALQRRMQVEWLNGAASEASSHVAASNSSGVPAHLDSFRDEVRQESDRAACCLGCGSCQHLPEGSTGHDPCQASADTAASASAESPVRYELAPVSESFLAVVLLVGGVRAAFACVGPLCQLSMDVCIKPAVLAPIDRAHKQREEASSERALRDVVTRDCERRRRERRLHLHAQFVRRGGMSREQAEGLYLARHGPARHAARQRRRDRLVHEAGSGAAAGNPGADYANDTGEDDDDQRAIRAVQRVIWSYAMSCMRKVCCCADQFDRVTTVSVGSSESESDGKTGAASQDMDPDEPVTATDRLFAGEPRSSTSGKGRRPSRRQRKRMDTAERQRVELLRSKVRRKLAKSMQGTGHVPQELLDADIDALEKEEADQLRMRDHFRRAQRWTEGAIARQASRRTQDAPQQALTSRVFQPLLDEHNELRQDVLEKTRRAIRRGRRYSVHRSPMLLLDAESADAADRGTFIKRTLKDKVHGIVRTDLERAAAVPDRPLTPEIPGACTIRPRTRDARGRQVQTDSKGGVTVPESGHLLIGGNTAQDRLLLRDVSSDEDDRGARAPTGIQLRLQQGHGDSGGLQRRAGSDSQPSDDAASSDDQQAKKQHAPQSSHRPASIDKHIARAMVKQEEEVMMRAADLASLSTHTSDLSAEDLEVLEWEHIIARGGAAMHPTSLPFQPTAAEIEDELEKADRRAAGARTQQPQSALAKFTSQMSAAELNRRKRREKLVANHGNSAVAWVHPREMTERIRRKARIRRRAGVRASLRSLAFEEAAQLMARERAKPRVFSWSIVDDPCTQMLSWAAASILVCAGVAGLLAARAASIRHTYTHRWISIDTPVPDALVIFGAVVTDVVSAFRSLASSFGLYGAVGMPCSCMIERSACQRMQGQRMENPGSAAKQLKPKQGQWRVEMTVPRAQPAQDLVDFMRSSNVRIGPAPSPRDQDTRKEARHSGQARDTLLSAAAGTIRSAHFAPDWLARVACAGAVLDLVPIASMATSLLRAVPELGLLLACVAAAKIAVGGRQPCGSLGLACVELQGAQCGFRTPRARASAVAACCGPGCRRGALLGACACGVPMAALGVVTALMSMAVQSDTVAGRDLLENSHRAIAWWIAGWLLLGAGWGASQACRAIVPLRLDALLLSPPWAIQGPKGGHANRFDVLFKLVERRRGILTRKWPLLCGCCEGDPGAIPGMSPVDGLLDDVARLLGCMQGGQEHFVLPAPGQATEIRWVLVAGVVGAETLRRRLGKQGMLRLMEEATAPDWGSIPAVVEGASLGDNVLPSSGDSARQAGYNSQENHEATGPREGNGSQIEAIDTEAIKQQTGPGQAGSAAVPVPTDSSGHLPASHQDQSAAGQLNPEKPLAANSKGRPGQALGAVGIGDDRSVRSAMSSERVRAKARALRRAWLGLEDAGMDSIRSSRRTQLPVVPRDGGDQGLEEIAAEMHAVTKIGRVGTESD